MLFSEVRRHPVMATDSVTTVGRLERLVVDPAAGSVIALQLKKSEGEGDTLHWEDMIAFGPDAITITGTDVLASASGRAAEVTATDFELVGKRVLTDGGTEIGKSTTSISTPRPGRVRALLTPIVHENAGDRRLLLGPGGVAGMAVISSRAGW
jgi:sporulation protein YlmC with PRC-barrel domain